MSQKLDSEIAVIGIDIGKNSFHLVGQDRHGRIVLRQKWSRGQVEARLANLQPCLIGMEACVGAHHLSRKLQALGHDAWLMIVGNSARRKCSPCRTAIPRSNRNARI
jgi:transposase